MKKIIVITDGRDLRAFRMHAIRGDRGLEFRTSEIECRPPKGREHDPALLQHAIFGGTGPEQPAEERVAAAREATAGGDLPDRPPRLRPAEIRGVARRIGECIRREQPDFWNLVAPPDLSNELAEELDQKCKDRLTRVRLSDLVGLSADQVEKDFHPLGADHP